MAEIPDIPDILRKIMDRKVVEVAERRQRRPYAVLEAELRTVQGGGQDADAAPTSLVPRGFAAALQARVAAGQPAVIAEIKKASPSKGVRSSRTGTSSRAVTPTCKRPAPLAVCQ